MDTFIIFLMFFWVILVTQFIIVFMKHDLDFDNTMTFYKNLFKRRENKKEESINSDKVDIEEDIAANEEELNKANQEVDINDLSKYDERPDGFPIDLKLSGSLTKEEKIIRQKVYKKIKTEPSFFHENGQKKMIVPLEALMFLNKDLNPLVNEKGEIIISVKENEVIEELKEIIMSLKTSGEILYKSDEEILESMKILVTIARDHGASIHELGEMFKEKLVLKSKEHNLDIDSSKMDIVDKGNNKEVKTISEKPKDKPKLVLDESLLSEEDLAALNGPKEEDTKKESKPAEPKKEVKKKAEAKIEEKKKEELVETKKPTELKPLDQVDKKKEQTPEEMSNEDIADMLGEEAEELKVDSMEDLLAAELKDMNVKSEVEVEEKKDISIKEFLQGKKWQEGDGVAIDWKNIEDSVQNILSNQSNLSAFLLNIAKQQPLVFNDNKTVVFVDIQILHVAFAKLFGVDYATIIQKLNKMPARIFNKYKEGMVDALGDHVSDLITNEKRIAISFFQEDNVFYRGNGLWLDIDTFKVSFDSEEFDFFRSFPLSDLKTSAKHANAIPLVKDINSTTI